MQAQGWLVVSSVMLVLTGATPGMCASIVPGWPQTTGDAIFSSAALGDLDGDGRLEVVIGSNDGKVYAWRADGSPVAGWPVSTGKYLDSSPAIGDLDGDGRPEVVIGSEDGSAYAWHGDGTPVSGWPQSAGSYVAGSPVLAELNGDGQVEVVVGTGNGQVYVWHADGSIAAGWPQTTGSGIWSSPAAGDLDGDGGLDVVIGSKDHLVHAWHADGTPLAGWPQSAGAVVDSTPALGDVDGDGGVEVVVGSVDGVIHVWHGDGTPAAGWPRSTGSANWSSPMLGDLDGDGGLEVVADVGYADHNAIYVWRGDGTAVPGWPQRLGTTGYVFGSTPLGDLDGDGKLEVIAGYWRGGLYAWHADGTPLAGWPQSAPDTVASSPALGDLTGDGHVEVVAGCYDHNVYVWQCDTTTTDRLPWPMFHHDARRTGLYRFPAPVADFAGTPTTGIAPLNVQFTDRSIYRPAEWSWSFGDGATSTAPSPLHSFAKPGAYTVSVTVSNAAGSDSLTKPRYILATFSDVPEGYWALDQILACVAAGIVNGYPDGSYAPTLEVTRDQMAVYISRALVIPSGDAAIPDPTGSPSFSDVPADHWAYRWIEYAVSRGVVQGYSDGTYHPDEAVNRGQMAVYIARAVAGGDSAVPPDTDGATFTDVTDANDWAWCYRHVEYCVASGIVQGYSDGTYRPQLEVTRDQMAVYVQRAFQLPM